MVTERGRVKKHKFYLPKQLVKGYDGEKLWFNITEDEAEDNFMKEPPPKQGEYSRYESASVTELPDKQSSDDYRDEFRYSSFSSSSTEKINKNNSNNSQITINLKERIPLISSNIIYKKTSNSGYPPQSFNNNNSQSSSPSLTSTSNSVTATVAADPVVIDWDSIIHKGVRTNEMQVVGVVAAITDDSIIVTSAGARDEYNIPKDEVQSLNGSEVILNANHDRLNQFEVKVPK